MSNLSLSDVFLQAPNISKLVFGRDSAANPAGELTTLPDLLGTGS